ncbi:hypothetical protein SCP_0705120 [Sparassis crispa]|uniref:Uncharacterized protein n=1 Tax=Sparassis crispa TaxID=139825 RepID=A0A401GSY1_9APHY|nr:hypothetical protein SCP_0705120 [Sparassis crispa]GBE85325.1 hypothetical protein SCP_0705120 [Sparassis crispa]
MALREHLRKYYGGKLLSAIENFDAPQDMEVHWVTEALDHNSIDRPFIAYGNEASVGCTYMHLCLIVEIGKAGERKK